MPTLLEKIEASAAARLPVPEGTKPQDELRRYKNFLKVETHRLKILHRAGASGREICHARAAILDLLLRYIFEAVQNTSPDLRTAALPRMALVAIGGYGRAELNPFSDIDFMFLHDGNMVWRGKPLPSLTALTDGLLYTLWDIGLKVGHSVRSIDDCVKVAIDNMQSKTSLIEARLICGDAELFHKFQKTVVVKCVAGYEGPYIQARLQDQASRRAKFGNSALMQEPNIKNGCGGLRDFQNLVWMTFFKYRTRSLKELEQKEMISAAERKQLESAYDYLLRARNELHYHVERPVDVLTKSVQPSVAHNLGYTDRSPSARLEDFMRDFYMHSRNIDLITRTVEQRLALVPQQKLMPSFRDLLRTRSENLRAQVVDGFKFLDGQIYPQHSQIFRDRPWRLMRVFLYAQQRGLSLHPDTAQLIRNSLPLVNKQFLQDEHIRQSFLEILDSRGNVAPILRAMHEVGLLGKFIPEFGKLTCLVQHEFYHQYTADEHTLVCIEKLDSILTAKTPPFSGYTEMFQRIERPYILYLALLLHDSGKASAGRHEEIGGVNATKAAKRLGLDGATTHSLRLLIENHLAMAVVSQRRDLDDKSVIRSFASLIQTVSNLEMLTLHTFSDSMGTSDNLWNSFKDSLLRTLFDRTHEMLTGGTESSVVENKHRELLADEVRELMPHTFSNEELAGHFANLPPRYFQINDAREILTDLALVHRFMHHQLSEKDEALIPVVQWHNEPDRGYTVVHICTWDRSGLFSKITGALTAAGFNIHSAEIITRNDGIVLDTFFVTDAKTGLLANRNEREQFEEVLTQILTGEEVNLTELISKAQKTGTVYRSVEGEKIPTTVHLDNSVSETKTVIDIQTEDRVGLLYTISQTLHELDLNLSVAKVSTEKGAAIDSFYVTDGVG
ncbi:MAG: uridylyltransferase, partial [Verrucomicrobiales bacterium]|nr:uridylyltransferase [Verrucomicrobiales bacterium]